MEDGVQLHDAVNFNVEGCC